MIDYDESLTLRDARDKYFAISGFNQEAYSSKNVKFRLGPLSFFVPNFPTRKKTVPLHDLHHILTGYETNWLGEAEVSAWEVASGGTPFFSIRCLIYTAIVVGLFINPAAVFKAYQRGRGSRNLFSTDFREEILSQTVGQLKNKLLRS